MPGKCTIVMYHYVRDLSESRFPQIRGRTISHFRAQIAYMQRFYDFISVNDLIEACHGGRTLPRNSALLSFDDGYSDHYLDMFPILDAAGIQGCFFPRVSAQCAMVAFWTYTIHFLPAITTRSCSLTRGRAYNGPSRWTRVGYCAASGAAAENS
jgi:hypothetical protein